MRISAENWDAVVAAGWRWECNFIDDPEENRRTVEALREEYGVDRVQIAVIFDHEAMCPSDSWFDGMAVYVKDVDELLAELEEDLLNWNYGHEVAVESETL